MSTATATATRARRLEDEASDQEGAELVVHVSSPLERLRRELDGVPVLGAFPLMSQLVHEELRQLFVNFLATTSRLREFLRNKKAL